MAIRRQHKLRSDCWEGGLSEDLRERLYDALLNGRDDEGRPCVLDYAAGAALAAGEPYRLAAPSVPGYYRALGRARGARAKRAALSSLEAAAEVAPLIRDHVKAAVGDEALADTFASLSATAVLEGAGAKTVSALGQLACSFRANALRADANRTAAEQLKLAREKFEAAEKRLAAVQDAVKTAKSKGGLTEETLKKIEEAAGLL